MKRLISALLLISTVLIAAPAHATTQPATVAPLHPGWTVRYTRTQTSSSLGGVRASGVIGGGVDSNQGYNCNTITLTRSENYLIYTQTDYEAHNEVCWQWNKYSAFGPVVFNVSTYFWVDHLAPLLFWGPSDNNDVHSAYQYACMYLPPFHASYCGNAVSWKFSLGTQVKQCVPACIQTESILTWQQVFSNGQWLGDIEHS